MKHTLLIVIMALGLAACSGDDEAAENNADNESPALMVTPQTDTSVVQKLQNAVGGAADKVVEKTQLVGESAIAKTGQLAADGQNKLAEYQANVNSSDTLDKIKKTSASALTKTGEIVDETKAAGQNVLDKGKEIGAAAKQQSQAILNEAKAAGRNALDEGKKLIEGRQADEAVEVDVVPTQPQSSIGVGNEPEGITKEALNALIEQLETTLQSLEKVASETRDAAGAPKRGAQG